MPDSFQLHSKSINTYSSSTANQSFDKNIIREHIKFLLLFTLINTKKNEISSHEKRTKSNNLIIRTKAINIPECLFLLQDQLT